MKTALVDMDGTIADYDTAMLRDLNAIRSPDEPEETLAHRSDEPYMKARALMIRSQPGWWYDLAPIKSGLDVVGLFRKYGFSIHILTKAPHSVNQAWTEKVNWVKQHLPDADITITAKKEMVNGDILFDDWPQYGLGWLKTRPNGLVIMTNQK